MTAVSAREIAGKLTKASRRAIVRIDDDWTPEGPPGPKREYAYSLWWGKDGAKGLVECPRWNNDHFEYRLTTLGLEVKAILEESGK